METLLSTRNLLIKTLENSSSLLKSSQNLQNLNSNLLKSSHLLQSLHRRSSLSLHAHLSLGPASAVLSAHSSVLLLHRSLSSSDPSSNLPDYLRSLLRLEQALAFLTRNCDLAITWLNDVVSILDNESDNKEGSTVYVSKAKMSLKILRELRTLEMRSRLPDGMISLAIDKLEIHLARIFDFTNIPYSDSDILMIVERMRSNGRDERVGRVYVEARVAYVKCRIFEMGVVEQDWLKVLEFVVKEVIQFEHEVCKTVSEGLREVSMDCYGEIIDQSGFLDLLEIGNRAVATTKKEAVKLLKLLEVFAALDGLRMDFNRLFGGRECEKVRDSTRDLIKNVVEGASEIFNELVVQVLDYSKPLENADAGVPRLVTFVTNFCHLLLDKKYRPVLVKVLSIHRIWNRRNEDDDDGDELKEELCKIMGALEVKLKKWSKSLKDPNLAYFFLMNNYHYLHLGLKETEFGDLLGKEWIIGYSDKAEFYEAEYLKQSWGRLSSILMSDEGVDVRLREFNDAFDCLWERQSRWVIYDQCLRERACGVILQGVIPAYTDYLQGFALRPDCSNCVKYSRVCLESLINSMFKPNAQRTKATEKTHLRKISRIASLGAKSFPATPVTTR